MGRIRLGKVALAVGLVLAATSCTGAKHAVGVQQVDGLVGRVERIHLDAELGRERVQEAVAAVRAIVRQEFTGEAAEAYDALVVAIERSEAQAKRLRAGLEPLQEDAVRVYESWTADLESFTSPTLKRRSQERRDEAGERYLAVVAALPPVADGLDTFNRILRDHALFLSYDLNTSAVREIEPELERLRDHAEALDDLVDRLLFAAGDFVRATAPLGRVHLTGEVEAAR